MIVDLLKQRFNSGKRNNLYFWRDNTGHEIDVLAEDQNKLTPIEIKSGKTITADYFTGINFWNKLSGNAGGTVIYAGDSNQKRSNGIEVVSWKKVVSISI